MPRRCIWRIAMVYDQDLEWAKNKELPYVMDALLQQLLGMHPKKQCTPKCMCHMKPSPCILPPLPSLMTMPYTWYGVHNRGGVKDASIFRLISSIKKKAGPIQPHESHAAEAQFTAGDLVPVDWDLRNQSKWSSPCRCLSKMTRNLR